MSPYPPLSLYLLGQPIDCISDLCILSVFEISLDSLILDTFALFLQLFGEMLFQNGLMTLGFAILSIDVVEADLVLDLSENLVLLGLPQLLLFDFREFSLGLFLELVS